MLTWFSDLMKEGLELGFALTNSYGLAIILLTIVIRIVLWPLTVSQTRATQKMQMLNPEQEELKKKYKNNPERLNKEMMELWKKHKVNPLSGCLLLLVQFPFLIAFFRVLYNYNYTGPASFLWLPHLGQPDPYYILPVLAGVTTYLQTRLTTPGMSSGAEGSQNFMLYFMPALITYISLRFAAGLALYWVVSNAIGIAQHYLTPKPKVQKGEASS